MKKLVLMILCVTLCTCIGCARTTVSRNVNDLPAKARTTLTTHFGKVGVNHIKIDHKTFGGREYDVILNDGTEIEFNNDGDWTEIDCGRTAVPSKLILPAIQQYVKKNFSGASIVQIEAERSKYKVELNTGLDLEFGRDGSFLRVDD